MSEYDNNDYDTEDEDYENDDEGDEPWDGFNSDAEADADVLRSAGFGANEDYGDGDSFYDE